MKKMLMLLSTSIVIIGSATPILASLFVSCKNPKNTKTASDGEELDYEYGSIQETNTFSENDSKNYVYDSLVPVVSLLSSKLLNQSANEENFDFITVFNNLQNKVNNSNPVIWNKQSVTSDNYNLDVFLDDWTFQNDISFKEIETIKNNFIAKSNESEKQKVEKQLNKIKAIKNCKKHFKENLRNIQHIVGFLNNDNFKKSINLDSTISQFINKTLNNTLPKNTMSLFKKAKPRLEQIYNNFINGTTFDDIKDLTNVNNVNLISYIKNEENIKTMNENFNSKTDDEKALMLFMIKLNYMYKHISSSDDNPENGEFLLEALFKDVNILNASIFSKSQEKLLKNLEQIGKTIMNYLKDIYENKNSTKSLEPFYSILEGITYIIKQKFYKVKIDQPINNLEIKIENLFEIICEFVTIIKADNKDLKYLNINDGKEIMKDIILESSLLEGIFVESEHPYYSNGAGAVGAISIMYALSSSTILAGLGAIPGYLLALAIYNIFYDPSSIPVVHNDNLKNYLNESWLLSFAQLFTDKANLSKSIANLNLEQYLQKFLKDYRIAQEYQTYLEKFDKVKDVITNDKNNSLFKELQEFINKGGFKEIINNLLSLIEQVVESTNNNNQISKILDNLLNSIGIDRQSKDDNVIIKGSILASFISWISEPDNTLDKTFDEVINVLEQDCKQWNNNNFENYTNDLVKTIKEQKGIKIKHINFEKIKSDNNNNCSNSTIVLNYQLKILATNEKYNIGFKNKNFNKFAKNFKLCKFEKIS